MPPRIDIEGPHRRRGSRWPGLLALAALAALGRLAWEHGGALAPWLWPWA